MCPCGNKNESFDSWGLASDKQYAYLQIESFTLFTVFKTYLLKANINLKYYLPIKCKERFEILGPPSKVGSNKDWFPICDR